MELFAGLCAVLHYRLLFEFWIDDFRFWIFTAFFMKNKRFRLIFRCSHHFLIFIFLTCLQE
jgi:hypothetical protein